MKRLNKITLILVAVMGIVISGCGGDIKKAPRISRIYAYANESITIQLKSFCVSENFMKSQEIYDNCWAKLWSNVKFELISLKGRRDCSKLPVKYEYRADKIIIESNKDCPPKDRLNKAKDSWGGVRLGSYEFTIKTNYGTFRYDTSNEKSKWSDGTYGPIK